MASTKKPSWNKPQFVADRAQLDALDEARDMATCGRSLSNNGTTRFAIEGAHDPTATFYFILEDLFDQMEFDEKSWLLDVGCSRGRTLAFFEEQGLPGRATGVELDPDIARYCAEWVAGHPNLELIQGNALELPLERYTHFYLFNPFDSRILAEFVRHVEEAVTGPITFCHMSDNGEYYLFWGRYGWKLQAEGEFRCYGDTPIYECAQHYSIWRYDPAGQD